jgi:hypothetical protein
MKLKNILEYNDYSYLEDEYGDDLGFQTTKPKKRAKVHKTKNFKKEKVVKRESEYTHEDLIKRYNISGSYWLIMWNDNIQHDLLDRIVNRTEYDVPYVNTKMITIMDYIEKRWDYFESGSYIFSLRKSNFKIVIKLDKFKREIYVKTILAYEMKNFEDIVNDVILNENLVLSPNFTILKDITLFI